MHILEIPSFFPPYGGLFCLDQAKALKALGHEVRILSNVQLGATIGLRDYVVRPYLRYEHVMDGIIVYQSYQRGLPGVIRYNVNRWVNIVCSMFDDYVQPNEVVNSGEIDANYFQHVPYLDSFNAEKGTDLVVAGRIHYEPLGIYPGTKKTLEEIGAGDVIAIPNDTTNEARALLLLQDNGIIKLKEGASISATKQDIAENPYGVEIKELEAAQIPHVKDEVAYSVMNGNYALQAGLIAAKDALSYELSDSEAASTYVNVIAVKAGNEENEGIKALVEVLRSDEIKQFITEHFDGGVIFFEE